MPLASILIPTYNYGQYIEQAIDSILLSDFPETEVEIIVIDDGSIDNTELRLNSYKESITYEKQSNQGKAAASRRGIELARGKYFFNLDADDLFLPDKLSRVVEEFERDDDIVHIGHPAIFQYEDGSERTVEGIPADILGKKLNGQMLLQYFYERNIMYGGGSTFAARTEILKDIDIPSSIDMYIDEYLLLKTLESGYSVLLSKPYSIWRIHGSNFSETSLDKKELIEKQERSIASKKAALEAVKASSLDKTIRSLYELQYKTDLLAHKEQINSKKIGDILNLWTFIWHNKKNLGPNLFSSINQHFVLNRSLPNFIFKLIKR